MNLIEALKISKKVKLERVGFSGWIELDFSKSGPEKQILVSYEELASNDWEPIIEKKTKKVVMYQVLCRYKSGGYYVTPNLYRHLIQASTEHNEPLRLLTEYPIEVEVSE